MKKYLVFGVLGLVIVLGWLLIAKNGGAASDAADDDRSRKISVGTIEENVTAQGKLEPRDYVDVGAQVTGQLKKIHFDIGDAVDAGFLLAEIDPRIYQARVDSDTAQIRNLAAQKTEQEAQLVLTRQRLAREELLIKSNATSMQTLQEARAAAAVASARVDSLTAQIQQVESTLSGDKTNVGFTQIHAPIAGVVVDLIAREGQTLNANQTAPIIMQLANLKTMTVRAQVAEADISRLSEGGNVYFTTLGMLERRWEGRIRQILPSPQVINEVVLFNVLIDVDNSDGALMKGMSTHIFFVLGRAENIPLIPLEALRQRIPEKDSDLGQAYRVQVRAQKGLEDRTVLIGLRNRSNAEVRSGLVVGDTVIAALPDRAEAQARSSKANSGNYRGGGARL